MELTITKKLAKQGKYLALIIPQSLRKYLDPDRVYEFKISDLEEKVEEQPNHKG